MNIAVLGYGGVSKAFIELISSKEDYLKREKISIQINYILNSKGGVYDPKGIDYNKLLDFTSNKGNLIDYPHGGSSNLTFNEILNDKNIDILIELTPTNKDTGEPASTYIKSALENKIHIITGNKGPILLNYNELNNIAIKNNVQLAIGCTTGGALPSINGGLFDMAGAEITSIEGVLNGTTNFILKEMEDTSCTYDEALKTAQRLGIAEANPSLDVEGWDTATKLLILTNVLMKEDKTLNDMEVHGISHITPTHILEAKRENKKYKLIGRTAKENNVVSTSVGLKLLDSTHPLYNVDGKNKGLRYTSPTLGDLTLIGGASGVTPAAASIFRDLININNGYKFSK